MANLSGNARYNYEKMREKILTKYGSMHLCGNCQKMMTCERMAVQNIPYKRKKEALMKKKAPFVRDFVVEEFYRGQIDVGFVTVYDCDRFLFDNPKGERICGMNLQYSVNQ